MGLSPLGSYHALMYGRSMYFDINKSIRELGWAPRYSNNEMFEEVMIGIAPIEIQFYQEILLVVIINLK